MHDDRQRLGNLRKPKLRSNRPWRSALFLLLPLLVLTAFACDSNGDGAEYTACPVIELSGGGPDRPPSLPYIFEGTYYVNGEPGPPGMKIWVQMARSLSQPARTFDTRRDGEFLNVIHGPLYDEDYEHGFVFCIGEQDGNSVMASSTPIPYEQKGTFYTAKDTRVDFPRLPDVETIQDTP